MSFNRVGTMQHAAYNVFVLLNFIYFYFPSKKRQHWKELANYVKEGKTYEPDISTADLESETSLVVKT